MKTHILTILSILMIFGIALWASFHIKSFIIVLTTILIIVVLVATYHAFYDFWKDK